MTLVHDDPWDHELTSEQAARFLEDEWLRIECDELRRCEVTWGDGGQQHPERSALESKARRALSVGVRQMTAGAPNPEFLAYLAEGITRFLDGHEKTLDQ